MKQQLQTAFFHTNPIAIVRTDHLGDMVLTLPMVAAIRHVRPEVKVLLFAHPRTAPLLYGHTGVEAVFVSTLSEFRHELRRRRPELLFFPRPVFGEVAAAWAARVRHRIGSGYRWYSPLLSHRIYEHRRTAERHEAEYNVRMVAFAAGVGELPVQLVPPVIREETRRQVEQLAERYALQPDSFVVLHAGGRGSAPRWEPESFAQLARYLEAEGIPCLFTGAASEQGLATRIRQAYRSARLLFGVLSTEEFIALLALARVVVANSTGALHIAAALGKAVVGLYSRLPVHHPRRWGPYTEKALVLLPPLEAPPDAVAAIPVEEVREAVCSLWRGLGSGVTLLHDGRIWKAGKEGSTCS